MAKAQKVDISKETFKAKEYQITVSIPPNEFVLESGEKLGPITITFETYGELSPKKDNAIFIFHALTGSAHAWGPYREDLKHEGWWNNAIGKYKMLNPHEYFIVVPNVLGSCYGTTGPTSINPKTGKVFRMNFPLITIGDMVRVHKILMDYLGIKKWLAIIGGSMGGMQVLDWITRYPGTYTGAIPIATSARLSPQAIALNYISRKAIYLDPEWEHGNYPIGKPLQGLSLARMVGHITYLSYDSMWQKFGREMVDPDNFYSLDSRFQVENYLEYQGHKFVRRFDANSYIYLTKAMDLFDLQRQYGTFEKAFKRVDGKILLLSFTSDWLFPARESEEIFRVMKKLGKEVFWENIESVYGHDAFLVTSEIKKFQKSVSRFLKELRENFKG